MIQYAPDQVDAVFAALGNATRRAIVVRLADGHASVSELAEPFGISLPAVSQHLGVLERAGLVEHRKEGRVRRCRLRPAPLQIVDDWVRGYRVFWDTRIDSLADHLRGRSADDR
ncbi:MAG TPA: metalloregulator ArsR/SmtB family transcription factor [Solirubrobacteraceae bacterium]|jgi:DNA-binding transcriptional ArsR family regulator|nr:metalloregulator ArsR/SmtB family transcription factor [Solirubrobacteraceae bacterium]